MTVWLFSLKKAPLESSEPTEPKGKERLMFELKAAGVYHRWHFSATQSGQLLHIESNNEKNATLFFSPPPPSLNHEGRCQRLQVLSRLLKQGLKRPNNNHTVRGALEENISRCRPASGGDTVKKSRREEKIKQIQRGEESSSTGRLVLKDEKCAVYINT